MEILNSQQLQALCAVIADTSRGYTKSEITRLLRQSDIKVLDDGSKKTQLGYVIGLSKKDYLYNCLVNEINTNKSFKKVYDFIEKSLNPIAFTDTEKRGKYTYLFEETNKVLSLIGLTVDKSGKIHEVKKSTTLDEADRRVNSLKSKLYHRAIHNEIYKYCKKDLLREDYFDAVFEASKGIAERVRNITGLDSDGGRLFQKAFSTNDPYIYFNALSNENEKNEFMGLKELLESIFHLIRNPAAHTPKINWKVDEVYALDVLTMISFAHKYLDECGKVPKV